MRWWVRDERGERRGRTLRISRRRELPSYGQFGYLSVPLQIDPRETSGGGRKEALPLGFGRGSLDN